MRHTYYRLDETSPVIRAVPCTLEEMQNRGVRETMLGSVRISTVFLGINHSFGEDGPPILWETMVFGGWHDGYQERYTSHDDAVRGHRRAVSRALRTRWFDWILPILKVWRS